MTYTPRAGSKIEKAIKFIEKKGSARTDAICKEIETTPESLYSLLKPACEAGLLTSCKVEVPGNRPMNEYRLGYGVPSVAQQQREYKQPRAVRRETRNAAVRFPALHEAPPPKDAAPADQPAPASAESASPPSPAPAVAAGAPPSPAPAPTASAKKPASRTNRAPELAINQSGAVTMSFDDGVVIDLTPAQTLALGTFLSQTFPLWRSAQ